MSFFPRVGPVSIGSRARQLSERLQADARQINIIYGSELKPRWFPLFYLLKLDGPLAISELAQQIAQTHPAVVRMVNELANEGLVERHPDPADARRSLVSLTQAGKTAAGILSDHTMPDVASAVAEIGRECEHNLWAALAEWEEALKRKSLLKRTLAIRKARTAFEVTILPFEHRHQRAWHDLNEAWISQYFEMEQADYNALLDPQAYILDRGGAILVAEYRGGPVATCALIPMRHPRFDYELAKMAVAPKVQGLGIGDLIGRATLDLARKLGARTLYLESNRRLVPALNLYRKLGFEDVDGIISPYARADVHMALTL